MRKRNATKSVRARHHNNENDKNQHQTQRTKVRSVQRSFVFANETFLKTKMTVSTASQWRHNGRLSRGKSRPLVNIFRGYFHPLQNTPRGYFHPLQNTPYKKTTAYNHRLFRNVFYLECGCSWTNLSLFKIIVNRNRSGTCHFIQ